VVVNQVFDLGDALFGDIHPQQNFTVCQRILERIEVRIRQVGKPYADQKVGCHNEDRCEQPRVTSGGEGQYDKDTEGHYKTEQVGAAEKISQVPGRVICLSWRGGGQSVQCGALGAMRVHVRDTDAFTEKFVDHGTGMFLVREQEVESAVHEKDKLLY
jgi:hypothetical protein